jgi:hypothetical protein
MKTLRHLSVLSLLLLQSFLWITCATGKVANTKQPTPITETSDARTLYETMLAGPSFTWYTGKARVEYESDDLDLSGNVTIRMERNKSIWAMVEKFGLEVARVLITQDSVFILDRINREYKKQSLAQFLQKNGVRITLSDMQNALVGKMVALTPDRILMSQENGESILTVVDQSGITAQHRITQTSPRRLIQASLTDGGSRHLTVANAQWDMEHDGNEFPLERQITFAESDGTTSIGVVFTEVSKNVPSSTPFEIPDGYAQTR